MGFEQKGKKLIDILGIKGKKIDIVPRTDEVHSTEIWNKKGDYLGMLGFDKRKKWKKFVLIELDKEMQMSKDCIIEAFKLTEDYWEDEIKKELAGVKE